MHRLPGKLFQNVLDHVLNKIVPFLQDERPLIQAIGYCGHAQGVESHPGQMFDELRVMLRGAQVSAYADLQRACPSSGA